MLHILEMFIICYLYPHLCEAVSNSLISLKYVSVWVCVIENVLLAADENLAVITC